jgi:hypothetical protein
LLDYKSIFGNIGSFAEVITGVLGIAITVVAIIVELAATRYTPRISELFIRGRLNIFILSFYILTCILGIWIAVLQNEPPANWLVILVWIYLVCVTISFVSVLPYFIYVFTFLHPNNIINRLEILSKNFLEKIIENPAKILSTKPNFLITIEQISDIGLNSIANMDRSLGLSCVASLERILMHYFMLKDRFPSEWFKLDERNFFGFSHHSIARIEESRTWVEMAVMKQYEFIFGRAVSQNRELVQEISNDTKEVALVAIRRRIDEATELIVIFFNTFLRISFNERNQYAIYNIFDQYRSLAEEVLAVDEDLPLEIANYFKYYGQAALKVMPFTIVIASNDLRMLNEKAYAINFSKRDELLEIFLELDKPPESEAEEIGFRGVRKSQAILAAFYLELGEKALARRIYQDMISEPLERMISIRDEILEVEGERFWEVTDRWINFDYVAGERREKLIEFFSWFEARGPIAKVKS